MKDFFKKILGDKPDKRPRSAAPRRDEPTRRLQRKLESRGDTVSLRRLKKYGLHSVRVIDASTIHTYVAEAVDEALRMRQATLSDEERSAVLTRAKASLLELMAVNEELHETAAVSRQQLEGQRVEADSLREALGATQARLRAVEEVVRERDAAASIAESEAAQTELELREIQEQFQVREHEVQLLRERERAQQEQVQLLQAQIQRGSDAYAGLQAQLTAAQAEAGELQASGGQAAQSLREELLQLRQRQETSAAEQIRLREELALRVEQQAAALEELVALRERGEVQQREVVSVQERARAAEGELERLRAAMSQQGLGAQAEAESLRTQLSEAQSRCAELEEDLGLARRAVGEQEQSARSAQAIVERLSGELEEVRRGARELTARAEQASEAEETIGRLRRDAAEAGEKAAAQARQAEQTQQELAALRSALEAEEANAAGAAAEVEELQVKLREAKLRAQELEGQLDQVRVRVAELEQELGEVVARANAASAEELQALRAELETAREAQEALAEQEAIQGRLEERAAEARRELQRAQEQAREAGGRADRAEAEVASLRDELRELESAAGISSVGVAREIRSLRRAVAESRAVALALDAELEETRAPLALLDEDRAKVHESLQTTQAALRALEKEFRAASKVQSLTRRIANLAFPGGAEKERDGEAEQVYKDLRSAQTSLKETRARVKGVEKDFHHLKQAVTEAAADSRARTRAYSRSALRAAMGVPDDPAEAPLDEGQRLEELRIELEALQAAVERRDGRIRELEEELSELAPTGGGDERLAG